MSIIQSKKLSSMISIRYQSRVLNKTFFLNFFWLKFSRNSLELNTSQNCLILNLSALFKLKRIFIFKFDCIFCKHLGFDDWSWSRISNRCRLLIKQRLSWNRSLMLLWIIIWFWSQYSVEFQRFKIERMKFILRRFF